MLEHARWQSYPARGYEEDERGKSLMGHFPPRLCEAFPGHVRGLANWLVFLCRGWHQMCLCFVQITQSMLREFEGTEPAESDALQMSGMNGDSC